MENEKDILYLKELIKNAATDFENLYDKKQHDKEKIIKIFLIS